MKTFELRLTGTSPAAADLLSDPVWSGIVVGNPGCVHKMPSIEQIEAHHAAASRRGMPLKIEIPVLFQQHFFSMFAWMDDVMTRVPGIRFVLNDFGSLHEWKRRGWTERAPLSLGRVLCMSYSSSPWAELALGEEADDVRQAMNGISLDNEWSIRFLQSCGVDELELDITVCEPEGLARLRAAGFRLNGLLDGQLLAVSRSCHAVRLHEAVVGQCQSLCDQGMEIAAVYHWNRYEDQHRRISIQTREKLPKLTVYGNTVWQKRDISPDDPRLAFFDALAVDARLSGGQMNELLAPYFERA